MVISILNRIGGWTIENLNRRGQETIFLFNCLLASIAPPYKFRAILHQMLFIGASSVFVIFFTGAFTGMVLGLQGYYSLRQFGAEGALGSAVGLSLVRELGPVLTALMVTGRAGSAICAEIGIMRNSDQIDALECMAIDPHKYIMSPKFIAAILCIPLLTSIFDVVGIFGGALVGVQLLGVNEGAYFQGLYKSVVWADVHMGIVKSLVFALLMVWICASRGFFLYMYKVGFGSEGVSRATTQAVVMSSVTILVADYLITSIML